MSEDSESWRQYRDEQKDRRATRLPVRTVEILSLSDLGYDVKKITNYQFRINDTLDLYPIHNRYHFIKNNKRGSYNNAIDFVKNNVTNA